MDRVGQGSAFHPASLIHCIAKDLETRSIAPKETSRDLTTMDADPNAKLSRVWPELDLEALYET